MNLVELRVQGERTAFVDLGSIVRIVTGPGLGAAGIARPDNPIQLVFRDGGEPLEVFGISVLQLLGNANATAVNRGERKPFSVIFIDDPGSAFNHGGEDE